MNIYLWNRINLMKLLTLNKITGIFISLYLLVCFVGNYICTSLYYNNCTSIMSYNSPICMILLTIIGGLSILYSYIWYVIICTLVITIFRHLGTLLV